MTKDDFIIQQRAAKGEEKRVTMIWMIVFFGVLFGNLPVAAWMDHHKEKILIHVIFGILFFGFLIGSIPILIFIGKRRIRKFGLVCPNCQKPLFQAMASIAIASGNCGHCGNKVFDE
jgi:hypothetical protein